jgi:predicted DNA-binding transcriptional regulator AlpA
MAEPFVTAGLVAEHLGTSVSLVRKATVNRTSPMPHHRIPGRRSVRYLLSEINEWIQDSKFAS